MLNLSKTFLILYVTFGDKIAELFDQLIKMVVSLPKDFFVKLIAFLGNTSIFKIENPYGGIPQNLLTNLIGLSILLSLFLILRKSAWKVINRIVPKNDMDRWNHIFFSFSNTGIII